MTIAWDQSFVSITNPVDSRHSISSVQLHHDATRDIVKTRAEPSAGHDRCRRLWRVEKQLLPRARELKTSWDLGICRVRLCAGDGVIQQHPLTLRFKLIEVTMALRRRKLDLALK